MKDLPPLLRHESPDPVHMKNNRWYFYDETWADTYGPYKTEEEAREKLSGYIDYLQEGKDWMP